MTFVGTPVTSAATVPTNQEMVDAIKAFMYGAFINGGAQDFKIQGKAISRWDADQLLMWLKHFEEKISSAAPGGGITYARTLREY